MLAPPQWTCGGGWPRTKACPFGLPRYSSPPAAAQMEYGARNRMLRMKRVHPRRYRALAAAGVLAAACFSGCHNQQTALSNPFMAPDRVPPPATRVVAPGAAQPYYPGDPLPPSHASATTAAPPIATAPTAGPKTDVAKSSTTPLAFSNERTVSVPADDSSLRFALPPAPPPSQMAASPAPPSPQITPSAASPTQVATQPAPSQVVPASYTAADPNHAGPAMLADSAPTSPWRTPQVPTSPTAPAINVPPTFATTTAPQLPPVAGPTIPVTLRAVPSPAADTVFSQPPRIRFPSYDAGPQVALAANGNPVQQAAFVAPGTGFAQQPAPQPGLPQTLPITEIQTSGAVPGLGPTAMPSLSVATQPQSPSVLSPDGFRARGTMR
jgi:hypothetical protein